MIEPNRGAAVACTGASSPLLRAEIERLYRAHGHLVLRRARAIVGNEADAQEALQEVFAALLHAPDEPRRSVVGWLYAATTHHCLNLLRNRRNGARLLERTVVPLAAVAGLARAELLAEARELVARLPVEVAAAVVYHLVDGLTYDEIAAEMGCSRRKVAYLLERARGAADGPTAPADGAGIALRIGTGTAVAG
jgi:RNA polymerase sigma factor (sigma-70 family)